MLQNLGASLEGRHLSNKSRPVLINLEKSETRKTLIHKNTWFGSSRLFTNYHTFLEEELLWTLKCYGDGFWIVTNIEDKLNWIHKNSHELLVWCVKLCWSINHRTWIEVRGKQSHSQQIHWMEHIWFPIAVMMASCSLHWYTVSIMWPWKKKRN